MFDRLVNWRGTLKVYAIKEAFSKDGVGFSRCETKTPNVLFVDRLANPKKNF